MADLLAQLGRLQVRFAPFLERYQNFMREDPSVSDEVICFKFLLKCYTHFIFSPGIETDTDNDKSCIRSSTFPGPCLPLAQ